MSISFRPHTISIQFPAVEGHYDDQTGDWVNGHIDSKTEKWVPGDEPQWSERLECRYESNGRARTVPIGENKDYVYSYTVYLDRDFPKVQNGQMVRLYDEAGELLAELPSKGFHRWQMHAQLWV